MVAQDRRTRAGSRVVALYLEDWRGPVETRQWTDPRSGEAWKVTLSGSIGVGARHPGDSPPQVRPVTIRFHCEDEHLSLELPTYPGPLVDLSDEDLQGFLDRARGADA